MSELSGLFCTGWWRRMQCLIFIGNFLEKSPLINGSFAERDLHYKAFFASSPLCMNDSCASNIIHINVSRMSLTNASRMSRTNEPRMSCVLCMNDSCLSRIIRIHASSLRLNASRMSLMDESRMSCVPCINDCVSYHSHSHNCIVPPPHQICVSLTASWLTHINASSLQLNEMCVSLDVCLSLDVSLSYCIATYSHVRHGPFTHVICVSRMNDSHASYECNEISV